MTCKYCRRPIPSFLRFCGKRCMERWVQANPEQTVGYTGPKIESNSRWLSVDEARKQRTERILRLAAEGKPKEEIALLVGVTRACVRMTITATNMYQEQESCNQ